MPPISVAMRDSLIRSNTTTWKPKDGHGGTYFFDFALRGYNGGSQRQQLDYTMRVFVTVTFESGTKRKRQQQSLPSLKRKTVGSLLASLVPRRNEDFLREAKLTFSPEFDTIARELFAPDGSRCFVRDDVVSTEEEGTILYLIHIEVSDWGMDLGLRLMHETLVFLKDLWAVVIMQPCCLDSANCGLDANKQRLLNKANQCEQDQLEDLVKMITHFVRMGFLQLGKNKDHFRLLFLPHHLYFKTTDLAEPSWITKEEAALVDLYVPTNSEEVRVLMNCLELVCESQVLTEEDDELIRRLATKDIIDSEALFHYIASHWNNRHLFDLFAENGGNVNLTPSEQCGRSPLHRAAEVGNRIGFQALVEHGADYEVQDLSGRTPLDYYLQYLFEEEDENVGSSDGDDDEDDDDEDRTPIDNYLQHLYEEEDENVGSSDGDDDEDDDDEDDDDEDDDDED